MKWMRRNSPAPRRLIAVMHYVGDTSAPDVKIETWIGTREERDRL